MLTQAIRVAVIAALAQGAGASLQELPAPQPGKGHARGVVLCPQGRPREGVPIYLHRLNPERLTIGPSARTDRKGQWHVLNLEPGRYMFNTFGAGLRFTYTPDQVRDLSASAGADFGSWTEVEKTEVSGCSAAPVPADVIAAMLRLAGVGPKDVVYTLGSSIDLPLVAARDFGATAVTSALHLLEEEEKIKAAGVMNRVKFASQPLISLDLNAATVVALQLLPAWNLRLQPKFARELKPGTRIVSWEYGIGDWVPSAETEVAGSKILLWKMPVR